MRARARVMLLIEQTGGLMVVMVVVMGCVAGMPQANANQGLVETFAFSSLDNQRVAQQLSRELRCPQCQNQNLVESNAPLAQEMRLIVYQQIELGLPPEEVVAFMAARFGDEVYYRPPIRRDTLVLWLSPMIIIGGIAFSVLRRLKGQLGS